MSFSLHQASSASNSVTPIASHTGGGRGATSTPSGDADDDGGDASEGVVVDAKAVDGEVVPADGWHRPALPA
jgi:hypothetical protein